MGFLKNLVAEPPKAVKLDVNFNKKTQYPFIINLYNLFFCRMCAILPEEDIEALELFGEHFEHYRADFLVLNDSIREAHKDNAEIAAKQSTV